ncbi:hypothetical protein AN964_24875 [Heyndrickxia shackletonii]|uniref:DNA-binding protein n=1 Tax=Heyndrickxia shackletonii TaxID=157838 RepID=A0A0Q3T9V9_9BACI|nr:hypothetical protein [Heyndrickxia shackletonii]KQL50848.1 hypothetical protein AN964_24875 [Heyndrickxia shackletonii]NEZ01731.1 DNA-binding protein [Heyndrickxia shackletonii]
MEFIFLAIGIALAGYFIGDGLKNFNNPTAKSVFQKWEESDEHELIKESDIHFYMGISKEDAKALVNDHPEIPHLALNGKSYYPKRKLREWLLKIGE